MRRLALFLALAALLLTGCGHPATMSSAPRGTPAASTTTSPPPRFATAQPATTAPAATTTTTSPSCAETANWATAPQTSTVYSTAALYLVQASQQPCFDRVVFTINGAADAGFSVRYVDVVTSEGKGDPLPVAGGAVLQVAVHAPELGYDDSGHQPGRVLANPGDYLYPAGQLSGWRALRAVRFAGFFEGQCSFAVGVRTALPFRVSTMQDSRNQIREVVLDVAVR